MKHLPLYLFLFLLTATVAYADDLATIRTFLANPSDDTVVQHGVYMACLNLTRTGTEEAVPLLKQLLDDERFSTVARTALINIPGDEGRKALRDSLQTLEGKNLIAVIQTLGNVRDVESVPALMKIAVNSKDIALIEAAFRALGNIAPKEATNAFRTRTGADNGPKFFLENLTWINDCAVNTAERLRQEGDIELALLMYDELGTPVGYFNAVLLMEEHETKILLPDSLSSFLNYARDADIFKVILRWVLELKSPDTGKVVLANMGNLPVWQQSALVRNLGARKDADIVPALIEMLTQSSESALRLAAIEALGEIGDLRAVDALLHLAGTPAEETADGRRQTAADELADTARESLKLFTGEEFDKKIIALLDHSDKNLRLAALDVISERKIAAASNFQQMAEALSATDREVRLAAYKAFANSAPPTLENIRVLLERLERELSRRINLTQTGRELRENDLRILREAIFTLCRRTDDRNKVVDYFASSSWLVWDGTFYLDCLFALGNEKAAAAIAEVAMITELPNTFPRGFTEEEIARMRANRLDTLHNRATELLGQWTTPEVAPFLIEIAEKHPNERYRSRTFRGYLRVIRQMGLPVEQKVQMAEKAVAIADAVGLSAADKEQAAEVLRHFRAVQAGE